MKRPFFTLLGLGRNEQKLISALASARMSVSELSRKTKLPRTTLNYELQKLHKRGLLAALPHGKRKLWVLRESGELRELLAAAADSLVATPSDYIKTVFSSPTLRVEVYHGAKSIYRLWKKLSAPPHLKRLYSIQPDASFNLAVQNFISDLSYGHLIEVNNRLRKNKVVVEALVHERSVDTIPRTIAHSGEDPAKFLAGFFGRLADTAKLPEDFMNVPGELYVCGDLLALIYWPEKIAIVITNKEFAGLFKSMFGSVKYLSARYDQNERLARKIVELEK